MALTKSIIERFKYYHPWSMFCVIRSYCPNYQSKQTYTRVVCCKVIYKTIQLNFNPVTKMEDLRNDVHYCCNDISFCLNTFWILFRSQLFSDTDPILALAGVADWQCRQNNKVINYYSYYTALYLKNTPTLCW